MLRPPVDVKPYRSRAEWVRIQQTWLLIAIAASSALTNILIALKVFQVI